MIIILLAFDLILLLFLYYFFKKDIFNPSFIFCLAFAIAFIDYILNIFTWGDISLLSFLVIFLGMLFFTFSASFVHYLYQNRSYKWKYEVKRKNKVNGCYDAETVYIRINNIFWGFFLIVQLVCIFLVARQVISLTLQYGGGGQLSSSISMYQHMTKFTDTDMSMPSWLVYFYVFTQSSGYVSGYLLINNIIAKGKFNILLFLNFIISLFGGILTGSRGGSLQLLISMIFLFVLLSYKKNGIRRIKLKSLIKIMLLLLIIMLSFEIVAAFMGRDNSLNLFEYISVYLGAPTKNLDIFLQNNSINKSDIFGKMTFYTQINWIGSQFNIPNFLYSNDLKFNFIKGHNLGNVYTTFYPFYYDFGFLGVIILTSIAGIFIELLYEYTIRKRGNAMYISFLTYSYFLFTITFSFFSNKFYEAFNITTLERILVWTLMIGLINNKKHKFKIRIRR